MRLSLAFFIPLLATTFALPTPNSGSSLDVRDGAELVERWDNTAVYERDSFEVISEKRDVGPTITQRHLI